MTEKIPETHKDLIEGPVFLTIATIMPDGLPQQTVVWGNTDGENILINTARGRRKEKNLRERPQASVMAVDPENPYRWLEVRGNVEMTEEGALDHIDQLANLYMEVDSYYGNLAPEEQKEKETRVILKVQPEKVIAFGD